MHHIKGVYQGNRTLSTGRFLALAALAKSEKESEKSKMMLPVEKLLQRIIGKRSEHSRMTGAEFAMEQQNC
ncbi:hypothetical protein E2562_004285 [Oryza meyeriana var. granulata]|uniref:Uncharacterized protein n=1 Tax=Oryza meyeriana var. granulata TaxID=110450 RepID=A0A6G1BS48_9ORYZ|nr:hypothetical protein E2562_004285 [Oryza meyeriana var. granulata]